MAAGSADRDDTFSSATSMAGSAPTSAARKLRPSASVTVIRSAFSTTWLFVRM